MRCSQKLAKKRKEREMYHLRLHVSGQPNVFVRILQKMKRLKVIPTRSQREWRTTYASAPKSHHLRERVKAKLIHKSRIENVPILEVIIDVWSEKRMRSQLNGLQWMNHKTGSVDRLRRPEESVRTRSIVRFAMRVPS